MLSLYLWSLSLTFIKGLSRLSSKSEKLKQKDRLTQSSAFGITNEATESQNQGTKGTSAKSYIVAVELQGE